MENPGDTNGRLALPRLHARDALHLTGHGPALPAAGAISPLITGDAGLVSGETTNLAGLGILVGSPVLFLAIVTGKRGVQRALLQDASPPSVSPFPGRLVVAGVREIHVLYVAGLMCLNFIAHALSFDSHS